MTTQGVDRTRTFSDILAAFLVMFERPRPMVSEASNLVARTPYVPDALFHALADGPHFEGVIFTSWRMVQKSFFA